MTAQIVQIRDYQSKRAIERAHKELAQEAASILAGVDGVLLCGGTHPLVPYVETTGFTETIPFGGQGIDGMDMT